MKPTYSVLQYEWDVSTIKAVDNPNHSIPLEDWKGDNSENNNCKEKKIFQKVKM